MAGLKAPSLGFATRVTEVARCCSLHDPADTADFQSQPAEFARELMQALAWQE